MTDFQIKFKYIYLRYLMVAVVYIGIYTFFNWYAGTLNAWQHIPDVFPNGVIPFALAIIVVLVWLRPRIKLLVFKRSTGRGNPLAGYVLAACYTIGITAVFAQYYMVAAAGRLTALPNINNIDKNHLTKYYQLQQHFISKKHSRRYLTYGTSGKGSSKDMVFYLHIVSPIFGDSTELDNTGTIYPKAWVYREYTGSIKDELSQSEKDAYQQEFVKGSNFNFSLLHLDDFVYLDRIANNSDYDNALRAINTPPTYPDPIVFEAVYTPFSQRGSTSFFWLWLSFVIGAALFFIMVIARQLDYSAIDETIAPKRYNDDWKNKNLPRRS